MGVQYSMRLQVGTGIDNYIDQLTNLEMDAPKAIGKAVYEGAAVVADAIKANIGNIPVDEDSSDGKRDGLKQIQIIGLKKGFGLTKMRDDSGYYNVKAGFDGYNLLKTKKYPNGQPNAMIARTIESGNSFTTKHPFVAPAVRASKDKAEQKMAEVIDRETAEIFRS